MQKQIIVTAFALIIASSAMGFFNFFRKKPKQEPATQPAADKPYKDEATNIIYNLLFCDDPGLVKSHDQPPYSYPYNILFAEAASGADLQKIIDDPGSEPRIKVLACNRRLSIGLTNNKELYAVIVEVGLDGGLDVLASFSNGTARYINQNGSMLIWEQTTDQANALTKDLFAKSLLVVNKIGPWHKDRKPHPVKGNTRITFLVSDGLYFGEAPTNILFNDSLAGPALLSATQLMQYLTEIMIEKNKK